MSAAQLLEKAARENPGREAVYDGQRRFTYHELDLEAARLAQALSARGIQNGDRVGVSLPNWHETVIIYFAAAKIGAVLVPFNPKYRLHEVQHILSNSGARLLFVSEEFDQHVGIGAVPGNVEEVITVRFRKENLATYDDLIAAGDPQALVKAEIDPADDVFCVLYTSGTTSAPKGAMLTHLAIVTAGLNISSVIHCSEEDVFLIAAPLFHVFGMCPNLMAAVYSQAKMVLMDKYHPQKALEWIQEERVTVHNAVPTMYIKEVNEPNVSSYDLSSLRVGMTGGAACPAETLKAVKEIMKMRVCTGYGLTEAPSLTNTLYEDEDRNILETVGKALPGLEIRIVNEKRETLPHGEVGEIACKGLCVMKGYYKDPEQTAKVLDEDGWFYTGDLGTMDEHGYVRFVGRIKEVIIRGGYNIYPREIEELLYQHPKVLEAAVIGLPDQVMGEKACAVIRLKEGMQSSKEEIISYLEPLLARYKLPEQVVFVDSFPMTGSGKIQKHILRDQMAEIA
jgi:fatty-acyl-CoA synthase/long-chain acyl-CoA synthetase